MDARGTQNEFHNQHTVHMQAGTQHLYGHTYHGPVYFHARTSYDGPNATTDADPWSDVHDKEILRSLSFAGMLSRRANIDQAHPDTCEWILSHGQYQSWLSERCSLLWIKGKPGAGKSTLMAFLHSRIWESQSTKRGVNLDFFFHASGGELQRTSLGMFRSLTSQLFAQDLSMRPLIRQAFLQKYTAFAGGPPRWQWNQAELEVLVSRAIAISAEAKRVTILVDALDEAGEHAVRAIIEYFLQLKNRLARSAPANVKICVSSRHYPILTSRPGRELTVEDNNTRDIIRYVNEHLDNRYEGELDLDSCKLWQELIECVTERAAGIFQWVRLVVLMIESCMDEGEPLLSIRRQLDIFPTALGEAYKHILVNVIPQRHRAQSYLLFQWVCLAERPLSVTELRYMLVADNAVVVPAPIPLDHTPGFITTNKTMIRRLVAISGGLVEAVHDPGRREEIVQAIHRSVNDYLLSEGLALVALLQSQAPSISQIMPSRQDMNLLLDQICLTLFKSCLNILLLEMQKFHLAVSQRSRSLHLERLSLVLFERVTPYWDHVEYAASHIVTHFDKAANHHRSSIVGKSDHLSSVLGRWLSLVTILKDASFGSYVPYLVDVASYDNLEILANKSQQVRAKTHTQNSLKLAISGGTRHCVHSNIVMLSSNMCSFEDDGDPKIEAVEYRRSSITRPLCGAATDIGETHSTHDFAFLSGSAPFDYWTSRGATRSSQMMLDRRLCFVVDGDTRYVAGVATSRPAFLAIMSSRKGLRPMLNILVAKHIPITVADLTGSTILHYAVRHGLNDFVTYLVEAQIDVNVQDHFGRTPVHLAIYRRNVKLVGILLSCGAALLIMDNYGNTPLDWVLRDEEMFSEVKMYCAGLHPTSIPLQTQKLRASLPQFNNILRQIANLSVEHVSVSEPIVMLGFWEFIRCLVHLGDRLNARLALDRLSHFVLAGASCFDICINCKKQPSRVDGLYLCTTCPEAIVCNNCIEAKYCQATPTQGDWRCTLGHEMLQVQPAWIDMSPHNLRSVSKWLLSLLEKHISALDQDLSHMT